MKAQVVATSWLLEREQKRKEALLLKQGIT
jgi:hypothetical protein